MDELLLLSGNDISFPEAQLTIHQPRLKDIAYITEEKFWHACELLKFDKEILPNQDKIGLSNMSNFNIIMTMIQEKTIESRQARLNMLSLLALMFPIYEIKLDRKAIKFQNHETGEISEINEQNFDAFKQILIQMFCLTNKDNKEYNPDGELARKIADKLRRGREKKAKLEPVKKIAIFSRYLSILTVGMQGDLNAYLNYTVYQLMDTFNRFSLKLNYDAWQRYRIAGATGLEDPQDWLKDIH